MTLKRDDFTRVYTSTGRVAHLLHPWDSPSNGYPATCGQRGYLTGIGWWGTGSQDEEERAAALPLCVRCGKGVPS